MPFTVQTEVGQYIADAAATSTVLTLAAGSSVADYTIRVRSEVTGENLSTPFPLSTVSFPLQPVMAGIVTSSDGDPTFEDHHVPAAAGCKLSKKGCCTMHADMSGALIKTRHMTLPLGLEPRASG
jgi:hypothetical protein